MLKSFTYAFSIALVLSQARTAAVAQTSAKDISSMIIAMERSALDRSDKGDCNGFLELSDTDVVYIDPFIDKPLYGLEALRTYYRGLPPSPPISGQMLNSKVQLIGKSVAVLTFNYVGKDMPSWNCTEVYRHTKNGWRIIQTHWSYLKGRPAAAAQMKGLQAAAAQPSGPDVASSIIQIERTALERKDPNAFVELSDPEVVYLDPALEKPIYGLEALRTYYHGFPESPQIRAQMLNSKVQMVGGDVAVLTFNYISQDMPSWNCTEVYRRTKNGWRIIQTHWSYLKGQEAAAS